MFYYEIITGVLTGPKNDDVVRICLESELQVGAVLKGCEIVGVSHQDEINKAAPISKIRLNPFPDVVNIAKEISFLKAMISTMLFQDKVIGDFESEALEYVILEAFAENHQKTSIDDIARHFHAHSDQRVKDMGTMLYPFTSSGQYGKWFDGAANVGALNEDLAEDMKQLANVKAIQQLFLLSLSVTPHGFPSYNAKHLFSKTEVAA